MIDWGAVRAGAAAAERAKYEASEARMAANLAAKRAEWAAADAAPASTARTTGQSCPVCGHLHQVDDDVALVGGALFCAAHAGAKLSPVPARHDIGCAVQSGLGCDCR